MISPQDEINARKSKMLWLLNSRRVVTDSDAVVDHDKTAQEIARPDAYVMLNANRKPNSGFRVEDSGEMAPQQHNVMQEAKQEIAEASGIHKSMQGKPAPRLPGWPSIRWSSRVCQRWPKSTITTDLPVGWSVKCCLTWCRKI